jgi:geranylgeranyl pyrophosphate synthase
MKTAQLANLLSIPELPSYLEQVDHLLVESLDNASLSIKEPALRLIKGGGKRLRPFLVIAAAVSQGGEVDETVLKACAAVELVHLGTIVHDDIIDDADIRCGVSTINKKEGLSRAIIVGDYLLALSAYIATSVSNEVANVLALATTEICDGQSQETADSFNTDRSIDSYLTTISKKTASLTSAACQIGALCAGLSKEQVKEFARFGELFGISFQIIDDLLDFLSTPESMGKSVGNDIKEGVYTLPLLLAIQGQSGNELRNWLGANPKQIVTHKRLLVALMGKGVFKETIEEIRQFNEKAVEAIENIETTAVVAGLAELPSAYLDWALEHKAVLLHKNKP